MDGRGRLLRSLEAENIGFPAVVLSSAGALSAPAVISVPASMASPVRWTRRGRLEKILNVLTLPGAAQLMFIALFAAVGVYGAIKGGHYAAFVEQYGHPADIVARRFGFSINTVTISGVRELAEQDLLTAAGIGPRNSLLFLDPARIREQLKLLPIVKDAAVTKLYPDRLVIEIEERQPFALWQIEGETRLVAEDGVALGFMQDRRFIALPLVAGAGANERLSEYMALLETAGDLRQHIVAGVRIATRRWTLKTTDGIDILLPERDPIAAMARLAGLHRLCHVLDKDLMSLDLRQKDRLVARLSAEAAAARESASARSAKAKGARP